MFGTFYEFDRGQSWFALDELRRRMDRLWEDYDHGPHAEAPIWPRANLADTGTDFVLVAEIPGLAEKDLTLTLAQDSLTVKGIRKAEAPEGYSVHRQERGSLQFSRTFALPARVDAEKVVATVKHGLLTVTLPKAVEVRPRQITIKAS